MMTLYYSRGDELPVWEASVTLNGQPINYTSETWAFAVTLERQGPLPETVTKTSNIIGGSTGTVTVTWDAGDLDIEEGRWNVQLTATRVADSAQYTIRDEIQIGPRFLAE